MDCVAAGEEKVADGGPVSGVIAGTGPSEVKLRATRKLQDFFLQTLEIGAGVLVDLVLVGLSCFKVVNAVVQGVVGLGDGAVDSESGGCGANTKVASAGESASSFAFGLLVALEGQKIMYVFRREDPAVSAGVGVL